MTANDCISDVIFLGDDYVLVDESLNSPTFYMIFKIHVQDINMQVANMSLKC